MSWLMGTIFIVFGVILLPLGMFQIREELGRNSDLKIGKKVWYLLKLVIDVLISPTWSSTYLYISILFMGFGSLLLLIYR
ncbi:hypothetical protein [Psychrobacillus vulpis]|uniref:Uncharacterized protein n=1 Tax=Psychrobacillus vulpis TaxID=2325572 RepID=A0A544TW81_9BACI|nr:hypothetical protein [Psychrobacillus vulpis]TQR21697.1 hypothetical protein FG384_01705 [Psychrobacillus vulpis]